MATVFQFPNRTFVEISLSRLVRNLVTLRSVSNREVIPVVKADAYGHGLIPVSRALVSRGCVEYLGVATLEEGLEIRKKISGVGIIVLSGFFPHQLDAYIKFRITPMIHNLSHLRTLLNKKVIPEFHIKVDTGMNRLGIRFDEMEELLKILPRLSEKPAGLSTHLADSDDLSSNFIDKQIKSFEIIHNTLRSQRLLATDARIHVANTGGILRSKLGPATSVRAGLGLLGVEPFEKSLALLHPVLVWKTRILCFKEVSKNESVGYGRSYKAKNNERLAILPIGYADGYPRLLSDRGEVSIQGRRAPIRGKISMDLTAVDVTDFPNIREGTSVTLLGKTGKDDVPAMEVAKWAETIPYEIFCGISSRVNRLYFE